MEALFPDAEFEIRIEKDEELTRSPIAFLKIEYSCSCYEIRPPKNSEFIKMEKSTRGTIMVSDAIRTMIDHGVNPDCKHYTLTGFKRNSDVQLTAVFDL